MVRKIIMLSAFSLSASSVQAQDSLGALFAKAMLKDGTIATLGELIEEEAIGIHLSRQLNTASRKKIKDLADLENVVVDYTKELPCWVKRRYKIFSEEDLSGWNKILRREALRDPEGKFHNIFVSFSNYSIPLYRVFEAGFQPFQIDTLYIYLFQYLEDFNLLPEQIQQLHGLKTIYLHFPGANPYQTPAVQKLIDWAEEKQKVRSIKFVGNYGFSNPCYPWPFSELRINKLYIQNHFFSGQEDISLFQDIQSLECYNVLVPEEKVKSSLLPLSSCDIKNSFICFPSISPSKLHIRDLPNITIHSQGKIAALMPEICDEVEQWRYDIIEEVRDRDMLKQNYLRTRSTERTEGRLLNPELENRRRSQGRMPSAKEGSLPKIIFRQPPSSNQDRYYIIEELRDRAMLEQKYLRTRSTERTEGRLLNPELENRRRSQGRMPSTKEGSLPKIIFRQPSSSNQDQ